MAQGREIVAAIKKASTWGTAVAAGAGDGILIRSEGLGVGAPEDQPSDEAGIAFQELSEQGNVDVAGPLSAFLRYEGLDVLLALAMGVAGAPAQQGTTAAYTNTYALKDKLEGLFATFAVKKTVSVWEWPGLKLSGFTIRGEAGRPLEIEFQAIADKLNRNTSGGTNNTTTIANVTYPDKLNRVHMNQLVARINDQGGAALASPGDDIQIASFALAYSRPMSSDHVGGQPEALEPYEGEGLPVVTLDLAFPQYTDDTYLDDLGAETLKKIDLTFTGATIEGAEKYKFQANIPQAKIVNGEAAVSGSGKIVHPLNLRLEKAQAAPSGMTVVNPFEIFVENKRTTDPLA